MFQVKVISFMQIWLNGRLEESGEAHVGAASAGSMLGWGVFTTIGVWRRRPFAIERHLARLRRDAARADVPLDVDGSVLENALHDLLARHFADAALADDETQNDSAMRSDLVMPGDGVARITVTRRGDNRWSHQEGSDICVMFRPSHASGATSLLQENGGRHATPHMSTHAGDGRDSQPVQEMPEPMQNAQNTFMRLAMSPYRVEARRALSGVKSTSYGDNLAAWQEAARRGFDEAVLRNHRGALCEGARSNLFWAQDGELRTPALRCGALPGIARELVCEWSQEDGIAIRQDVFNARELDTADEIFTTSAAQGPRAVACWHNGRDERLLTAPGPIATHFARRWNEAVNRL